VSSRLLPLRRGVVALAAVTAVVLGASACEVKPGAAAFVGDQKITESDVAQYVSTTSTASPSTDAQTLTPRAQVVSTLVSERLFREYLQEKGGVPSDAALLSSRDAAFQLVTGQSFPDLAQFQGQLEGLGYDKDFAELYATQIELEYEVIQRSKAASLAELAKAVQAVTDTPRISPRYGSWNAEQLSLSGSSATPNYLTLVGGSTGA
jgi:hypothetical protein